jgi:hypothetical protein
MPKNPNNDGSKHESEAEPDNDVPPGQYEQVESAGNVDTDQWVQVHQAHYDRTTEEELVTTLIMAIAEAKDVDPLDGTEMPPLYESLDAAALENTFFGPPGAGTEQQDGGAVTFQHCGCKVALRADGWIFVYEPQ